MGVEEDETGGAAEEALLEDLARFDGGAVEGAAVGLLVADQAVADVEEEGSHDLLVALLVAEREVTRHQGGPFERLARRGAPVGEAAGERVGGEERRDPA